MSLESLLASCWLLVIVIFVTVQHFPAAIVSCDTITMMMMIGKKRMFLLLLVPVPLLALIIIWRYRRRDHKPLPPSTSSSSSRSDDVTEELPIASQFVGFVIGRQGNKVKELEKQTNTRIRFREAKDGKVAMVTGQNDNVTKAKEAIIMMIKERSEKKQVKSVDVVIPHFAVGRLIGKQGQNISMMQKESGARIVVDRGGSGMTKICTISGNSEQVTRAVSLVQQCISESEAAQQRNKLTRKLKGDNINMKTAQIHSQCKSGQKEETPVQQSIQLEACSLPSHGEFFPAFVSNVSAMGHIWIQQVNDNATILDELSNEMMEAYCNMNVMEYKLTSVPSVGDYCAGKWCRYRNMTLHTTLNALNQLLVSSSSFSHMSNMYRSCDSCLVLLSCS